MSMLTSKNFKISFFRFTHKSPCFIDDCFKHAMTNAFIQMSGVFAELELRIIRERVRSGMANAKAKGARIGRPQVTATDVPSGFLRHYPAFKSGQLNLSELARVCSLSRTTVYKYIELLEK